MLKATHIVGGELTYKYLGSNKYKLRMDLYIDCENGSSQAIAEDATAYFAVFNGSTNQYIQRFTADRSVGAVRLVKSFYNCLARSPNACVDAYVYELEVTLVDNGSCFYLSFQRCCRNNSITNLNNPGATGANYWTKIPPLNILNNSKHNNSPVFKQLPPNFLCTNNLLSFDHSASDPDGDSLTYELFTPFLGGDNRNNVRPDQQIDFDKPLFTNVSFKWPYSGDIPILGNPNISIDVKTGRLKLNPSVTGQFVVGIKVKEWRNGILIGETKRDYQFNIQDCQFNLVASYFNPSEICNYEYQFQNKSVGAKKYFWDFGVASLKNDTSILAFPKYTFPDTGRYNIKLIAINDNCRDTIIQPIQVVRPVKPVIPADSFFCEGQSVIINIPQNNHRYIWSTGDTSQSLLITKPGQYIAGIRYKSCLWNDTIDVIEDKPKLKIIGDTVYCSYDAFNRRIFVQDSSKYNSVIWDNGNRLFAFNTTKKGLFVANALSLLNCLATDSVVIEHFPEIIIPPLDTLVCPETLVTFDAQNPDIETTWSTSQSGRYINLVKPGFYWVKVQRGACKKEFNFELKNHPNIFELGPDLRFCESIDTILTISDSRITKSVWNNVVSSFSFNLINPGKVLVRVTNVYGCQEKDSLIASLFYNPSLNLRGDTTVCEAINLELDAGPNMKNYRWNTGSIEQKIKAYQGGLYWVNIESYEGCATQDSIFITKDPNLIPNIAYMPNSFSPNGNGYNDVYPNNKFTDVGVSYSIKLFNRWGEKLADFNSPNFNWDGNINGNPAPDGVYAYLVTYIGCNNVLYKKSGSFHLMR